MIPDWYNENTIHSKEWKKFLVKQKRELIQSIGLKAFKEYEQTFESHGVGKIE